MHENNDYIKEIFSSLNKGNSWHHFIPLVTSEHDASYDQHVHMIENTHNEANFRYRNLVLQTSNNVYVPGIESSSFIMIRALLSREEKFKKFDHILEIGAGSGVVSMILNEHQFADRFTCTDVSDRAVDILEKNTIYNKLNNFHIIKSDLFDNIKQEHYDAIIFNAPLWHKDLALNTLSGANLALIDPNGSLFNRFMEEVETVLAHDGTLFISFSNLGREDILEHHKKKWSFSMIMAEYIAKTGVVKAIYSAKLHKKISIQ